jgi:hypothetical protein
MGVGRLRFCLENRRGREARKQRGKEKASSFQRRGAEKDIEEQRKTGEKRNGEPPLRGSPFFAQLCCSL